MSHQIHRHPDVEIQSCIEDGNKKVNEGCKIIAFGIWDAGHILLLNFLPRDGRISAACYGNILDALREVVRRKKPVSPNFGVIIHHDTVIPYTVWVTRQ